MNFSEYDYKLYLLEVDIVIREEIREGSNVL